MTHEIFETLIKRFKDESILKSERSAFYSLRRYFILAGREQGFRRTVEDAARLVDEGITSTQWREIAARHQITFNALRQVAQEAPRTFLDQAIEDLVESRPGNAIRGLGQIHGTPVKQFTKYRSIVRHGPDQGLTIWQLLNPFYYIWTAMPVTKGLPSNEWRDEQFNKTLQQAPNETTENEQLLIDFLLDEMPASFWSTARVLECGCGTGQGARLLVNGLGIDPSNYRGFDFHENRVTSTRSALLKMAMDAAHVDAERQVFALDILSPPASARLGEMENPDVIISASFTNVFTDEQLPTVLEKMTALEPKIIVDISVTTSWSLCIGRFDPSDFYKEVGYRLKSSKLEIPNLNHGDVYRLWMPEKYWSNRNILLYESISVDC